MELPEEPATVVMTHENTASGGSDGSIVPPLPSIQTQKHLQVSSQHIKGLGGNSMIRGQFDQTLRSMKDGNRTTRNRLSKIFLDS